MLCGGIMFTFEQHVLLFNFMYWVAGSLTQCQTAIKNFFPIAAPPKSLMQKVDRKLDTDGTLQTQHGGGRPAMTGNTVQDVRQRLLASPAESSRRLQTCMSCSSCYCCPVTPSSWYADTSSSCPWFQIILAQTPASWTFFDKTWFYLSA
jgi:hypothetical protein